MCIRDSLKDCPNVKLLQSTFAGYDNIDIKGINDLGIDFANNGGGNAIPVAEYTMGLINGVTRGVFRGVQNAREGNWNSGLREHPTWELTGKCVGIIGMGAIGQRVAQMLTGYECDTVSPSAPACPPNERRRFMPATSRWTNSFRLLTSSRYTPH